MKRGVVKRRSKSSAMATARRAYKTVTSKKFQRGFKKGLHGVIKAARKGYSIGKKAYGAYKKYAPLVSEMIAGMGDYRRSDVGGRSGKHGHHHARVRLEKGEMVIEHTEYLGDLVIPSQANAGSSPWLFQAYALNPGSQATCPWLSSVACNFQDWKADKWLFEYRPLVADGVTAAGNTLLSMGSVVAATQYNSNVGPYTSKQTAAESDYAMTCKPSEGILHPIECDVKYNPLGVLYVSPQTGVVPNQAYNPMQGDIRMSNLGIFQLASFGVPVLANTPVDLGEIWTHYKIRLMKPVLGQPFALMTGHYITSGASGAPSNLGSWGANVTAAAQPNGNIICPYTNPYTNLPVVSPNLLQLQFGIQTGITGSTVNTCAFPLAITNGRYMFIYRLLGSVASGAPAATLTIGNLKNCTQNALYATDPAGTILPDTANAAVSPPAGAAVGVTSFIFVFFIDVTAPGAALASFDLTISSANVPTGNVFFELWVTESNQGQY